MDSVMCQWRIESDMSRYETDLDPSGIKRIHRIKSNETAHAHVQHEADLPHEDLCSPDTATNANESSVQAPALIDNFVHTC